MDLGSARRGHYTSRDLHIMEIMSANSWKSGSSGWNHLRGVLLSEAALPFVHKEMCHSIRSHYTGARALS